jgi:hypothetical protein
MYLNDFRSEFNAVSSMSVEQAIFSFLSAAKRALLFNKPVVQFLLMECAMKNLSEATLTELVTQYNNLAKTVGKPERKTFASKAEALKKLAELDALIQVPTPAQESAGTTKRRSNTMSEVEVEKKPRGKGIGALAMELILAGKTTQEVIAEVVAQIPDAHPTTATISWYKNKLRQEGKLAKPERKPKAEKKAKIAAEPVVDETAEDTDQEAA